MSHLIGVGVHAPSMPLVMVWSPMPLSWPLAQPSPCCAMSAPSGSAPTSDGVARAVALPKVWPPAVSATVSSSFIPMRAKVSRMSRRRLRRGSGLPPGPFGIDVDQAHLDRGERVLERHLLLGLDAGLAALADPFLLGAPVDVLLGLADVRAAAAEAEHRAAHRFDRDVAGEDHQVGPAELAAVFLLDRPEQAARLVEIGVVRPAVERREALRARRRRRRGRRRCDRCRRYATPCG